VRVYEDKRTGGLVHAIAICRTCGWNCENYLTAWSLGKAHASRKGHEVSVDVGHNYVYDGTQQALKRKKKANTP